MDKSKLIMYHVERLLKDYKLTTLQDFINDLEVQYGSTLPLEDRHIVIRLLSKYIKDMNYFNNSN